MIITYQNYSTILNCRYILEHQGASLMDIDPEKLLEYNPQLAEINPTARIAYAKFKMNLIQQEYKGLRGVSVDDNESRSKRI